MIKQAIPLLHVSDSIAADHFYCGQLGFKKTFEYRPDVSLADPCYFDIQRDGALIHVSSFSGDGVSGGVVNLLVERVDDLYREFLAKGVNVDLTPTDQTWGTREMYIKDADGNCMRFVQG